MNKKFHLEGSSELTSDNIKMKDSFKIVLKS